MAIIRKLCAQIFNNKIKKTDYIIFVIVSKPLTTAVPAGVTRGMHSVLRVACRVSRVAWLVARVACHAYLSCTVKRCRRCSEGNMRNEPRWKLRVRRPHCGVWCARRAHSRHVSPVWSPSRHCSHRNPPRMRGTQRLAAPRHTPAGHTAY